MKLLIVYLFATTSIQLFAFTDQMMLKGGLSYSSANIEAQQDTEDNMKGIGFNTHFGYRWEQFEVLLSSYIYWGNIEGLTFQADKEVVTGEGSFRHVSFGPVVKYHFNSIQPFKNWTLFTGVGPVWSLQTVKFDQFISTGSTFNKDQKLTFDSFGGLISIGLEEQLEHKEAHPAFVEFIYSYKKSRKMAVVDASDFAETSILSKQEGAEKLSGHFFMVSIGITLF